MSNDTAVEDAAHALAQTARWQGACAAASSKLALSAQEVVVTELARRTVADSSRAVARGVDLMSAQHEQQIRAVLDENESLRTVCLDIVQNVSETCKKRSERALLHVNDAQLLVEGNDLEGVDVDDDNEQETRTEKSSSREEVGGRGGCLLCLASARRNVEIEESLAQQLHELVQQSSEVVKTLTEENVELRTRLDLVTAQTVPYETLLVAEDRIKVLEAECRQMAHQISFLVHDEAARVGCSDVVQSNEQTREAAPLARQGSLTPRPSSVPGADDKHALGGTQVDLSLLVHCDLWKSAIRQVEEKASVVIMNLEREHQFAEHAAVVESLKRSNADLENRLADLELLNREVCRDCEVLTFENGVLTQHVRNALAQQVQQQEQLVTAKALLDRATPHANKYLRGSERLLHENMDYTNASMDGDLPASSPIGMAAGGGKQRASFGGSSQLFQQQLPSFEEDHHLKQQLTGSKQPLVQPGHMPRNSLLGGNTSFKPLPGLPRLQTFANAENLYGKCRVVQLPSTTLLTGTSCVPSDKESDLFFEPFTASTIGELVERNKELCKEIYRLTNFSSNDQSAAAAEDEEEKENRTTGKRRRTEAEEGRRSGGVAVVKKDVGIVTDATESLATQLSGAPLTQLSQHPPQVFAAAAASSPPPAWLSQLTELTSCKELTAMCHSLLQSHGELLSSESRVASSSEVSSQSFHIETLGRSLRQALQLCLEQESRLLAQREQIQSLHGRLASYSEQLVSGRNLTLADALTTAAGIVASTALSSSSPSMLLLSSPSSGMDGEDGRRLQNPSLTEWSNVESLLTQMSDKEQLLAEVIRRNLEAKSAPSDEVDDDGSSERAVAKLREQQDARHRELSRLLEREQEKHRLAADQLHHERVAHRNLMERMWQLELSTSEAQLFAERARVEMAAMLSVEQYEQQAQELEAAKDFASDLQRKIDDARGVEQALREELARSAHAMQQQLADHAARIDGEAAEKRHLQQLITRHAQAQQEIEVALTNERHTSGEMYRAAEDLRRQLVLKEREVAEAKLEAKKSRSLLLEQACSQDNGLRSLFPTSEAAITEMLSLIKELSKERDGLGKELAGLQLAMRSSEQLLTSLRLDLRLAAQERQTSQLELQGVREREDALTARHSLELQTLQCRLDVTEREMVSLQGEKTAALEREEALRVRVEALAADPVSTNVRKYGIVRTKLLQEQIDIMHNKNLEVNQSLEKEQQIVSSLRSDLTQQQAATAAMSRRADELVADRDALRVDLEQVKQQLAETTRELAGTNTKLADTTSSLTSTRGELDQSVDLVESLQRALHDREHDLADLRQQLSSVGEDNVGLMERVDALVGDLESLEAQKRAQDATIAQLRRHGGQQKGFTGASGGSAGATSGRAGAARRMSPTAPTSLTRDLPRH